MLKKLLFNKYKILNIPENMPYTSEEIFDLIFSKKNVVFFKYDLKDEFRLLTYSGINQDFLSRATKFQPLAFAGSEVYPILSKEDCVVWNENPLPNCTNSGSYIFDDIEKYICQLNIIDSAIKINAKQIFIPFIAKAGKNNKDLLSKMLKNIFGEDYKNLIVEQNLKDQTDGTIIEPTNISLFLEQLQNAKKKILDEAFLYLGVGAPAGKLAHESEIEVQQNEKVVDLLDNVVFVKLVEFFNKINEKFGTKFEIIKEF